MASSVILAVGLVIAYGFVLSKLVPERFHFVTNIAASLIAIGLGLWSGLDLEAMGLSIHFIVMGILVAAACSLAILVGAGLFALLVPPKKITSLPRLMRPGAVAYETAVRIPLSTALSEEILFRGVLLAVLMQHLETLPAVIVCSAAFGIWHTIPSLRDHSVAATIPIVVATGLAGVFFCWLRLLSGSILAPWLVHWTINASGLLAIHFVHQKVHDNT